MKVNEIFFSLQGEGVEIGLPTVFVRLFACDLRCRWCDTMYAVEGRDFTELPIETVKDRIKEYDCKRVCITGGEPLIQLKEVERLGRELLEEGYRILLETSGHKMPPGIFFQPGSVISMDCKCPGSGMHERMDFELYDKLRECDQIKFVIQDAADFDYAHNVLNQNSIQANVIFQPAHGVELEWITEKVIGLGLQRVRVLPQLHKIIWGDKRGV